MKAHENSVIKAWKIKTPIWSETSVPLPNTRNLVLLGHVRQGSFKIYFMWFLVQLKSHGHGDSWHDYGQAHEHENPVTKAWKFKFLVWYEASVAIPNTWNIILGHVRNVPKTMTCDSSWHLTHIEITDMILIGQINMKILWPKHEKSKLSSDLRPKFQYQTQNYYNYIRPC